MTISTLLGMVVAVMGFLVVGLMVGLAAVLNQLDRIEDKVDSI